jgi:hypothetical protein
MKIKIRPDLLNLMEVTIAQDYRIAVAFWFTAAETTELT